MTVGWLYVICVRMKQNDQMKKTDRKNIAHLQARKRALKSRYTDRPAHSINLKIDMDATWKKSRILQKTSKRDTVLLKLHIFNQKKPSVRFKF